MKINPRFALILLLLLILLIGLFPWTREENRALLMGLLIELTGLLFLKYRKEWTDRSMRTVKEKREQWRETINLRFLVGGISAIVIGIFLFIASLLRIINNLTH